MLPFASGPAGVYVWHAPQPCVAKIALPGASCATVPTTVFGVAVLTPTGLWAVPDEPDGVHIEVAEEYVLVTIRDLPLMEEGTYRFEVHLDEQTVTVEMPVRVVPIRRYAEVH